MASPSVMRDVVTRGRVEPAYLGKHEQLMTRNGCHGNEQTSSGTPKRQTSPKKEQEDVPGDISTTASPRAKSPKKTSKRVDGKKTKKTQICAQTRSEGVKERAVTCKTSQSQPNHGNINSKSEDVLQAMSELKISHSDGKKSVADKGTTNAMETQLKRLSLEDTQQLVERGPQRNRDSHSAHQTKPYDKSTDPTDQRSANDGTDEQDKFIRSVLFDKDVVGASRDESGMFVPSNLQPCGQPGVDFVDQWLESITVKSPPNNVVPSTTIGNIGYYQSSGPSVSPTSVGVQSIDQSCGQVPVIVTVPGVPVQTVPFSYFYHAAVPLTQQTFVSGHPIPTTAIVPSGAPVPNAYIIPESICYDPNVCPVNTGMPGNNTNNYQPSPCSNTRVPHGNGTSMAGSGQASVPMGNYGMRGNATSEVGSESALNSQTCSPRIQADQNIHTQGDADLTKCGEHNLIPTVVPEHFDLNEDDSKQKKRGKGNKNGKPQPRKPLTTTKKERKRKDSPKKMPMDSVPTQSPDSNSGDASQLNLTASPLTNCVTPPLVNDQAVPPMTGPDDFDAFFEDSMSVVKSNLEEDFCVRKIIKEITSAARQGTSEPSPLGEQRNTSNNCQLPHSPSAVNQPPNTWDGSYPQNSLAHSQQSIPPVTVTQQVTHNQHMATLMQPVSVDKELQQTSQIQYPVSSNNFQTTNSMSSQQQVAFPADTLSTNVTIEQFPPHDQYAQVPQSKLSLGYQQATYGVAPTNPAVMTSPHAGPAPSVAPMVQNSPLLQTPQQPHCVQQTGCYPTTGLPGPSGFSSCPMQPLPLQSSNVQTQVIVNVSHQKTGHLFQQQPGPNAQYQHQGPIAGLNNVHFEDFPASGQFKMTTAGFAGSKPIGSTPFEDIMKKFPVILPKPRVS